MSDLKSGRKKSVTAETAQKIASYLGVSVEYLLGEETKKEQPTEIDGLSEKQKAFLIKEGVDFTDIPEDSDYYDYPVNGPEEEVIG